MIILGKLVVLLYKFGSKILKKYIRKFKETRVIRSCVREGN